MTDTNQDGIRRLRVSVPEEIWLPQKDVHTSKFLKSSQRLSYIRI